MRTVHAKSADLRPTLLWVLFFAFQVAVIQLPSLQAEVIDWDESTFALMAADILRGNLPYVHLYDIKPPLLFFLVAAALKLFGESVATVRIFGDVCILAIAVFTFLIAKRISGHLIAGLMTASMIAMSGASFALHTSAELPAVAFVMASTWVILAFPNRISSALAAGVLMALAILVRTNLVIAGMAVFLFFLISYLLGRGKAYLGSMGGYAIGLALPFILTCAVYYADGSLDLLILGAIKVPLSYSANQLGMLDALLAHKSAWFGFVKSTPGLFLPSTLLLLVSALSLGIRTASLWRSTPTLRLTRERMLGLAGTGGLLLFLLFAATSASILKSGAAFPHYWLQIYPFIALLSTYGLAVTSIGFLRRLIVALCLVAIGASFWHADRFVALVANFGNIESNYVGKQVAERIKADMRPGDEVWALRDQIILFHLDLPTVSPLVHPSAITRAPVFKPLVDAGYIKENEFGRIIGLKPRYVVMRSDADNVSYLSDEQNLILKKMLNSSYERWYELRNLMVYKRHDIP